MIFLGIVGVQSPTPLFLVIDFVTGRRVVGVAFRCGIFICVICWVVAFVFCERRVCSFVVQVPAIRLIASLSAKLAVSVWGFPGSSLVRGTIIIGYLISTLTLKLISVVGAGIFLSRGWRRFS